MKKFLLPCVLLICGGLIAQDPLLEESFEDYDAGSYIGASSPVWTTWSGTTGGDEDGVVSEDYALTGSKSLHIFGSAAGGPMDVYLPMGLDDPYELSFNVYVTPGNSAYFNMQENLTVAVGWAFDIVLDAQGNASIGIDQVVLAQSTYSPGSWTLINMYMDPQNNRAEIHVNGECLANVEFDAQIGGLNLFGYGDGVTPGDYYVDDLVVVACPDITTTTCGGTGIASVLDIIVDSDDHNTLEAAVFAAGLDSDLSDPNATLTVFAPTDAAFSLIPTDVINDLLADPSGELTQILLYHVVGSIGLSSDLADGMMIETLGGEDVTVNISNGVVMINDAIVIVADLIADNGVVHVIDAVLSPTSNVILENIDLTFGPNPAKDFIQLSSNVNEGLVKIMALNGKIVQELNIHNLQSGPRLNLDLENGIYLVELISNNSSTMRRLVVNH